MNWLLAVADVPGGGFERPDLPPGTGKLAALAILAFAGYLVWQSGLLDPSRMRSPLPTHRLRRRAYRVVCEAFGMSPVGAAKDDRWARAAHERQTIRELKRDGRYAVYVLIRHKQGLDLSKGSKDLGKFEAKWRHAMSRPDEDGNAAHDWIFQPYVGSNTIAVRWAPLPSPEVIRLYDLLLPTFKWPEGTRPAEVIHASADKETA